MSSDRAAYSGRGTQGRGVGYGMSSEQAGQEPAQVARSRSAPRCRWGSPARSRPGAQAAGPGGARLARLPRACGTPGSAEFNPYAGPGDFRQRPLPGRRPEAYGRSPGWRTTTPAGRRAACGRVAAGRCCLHGLSGPPVRPYMEHHPGQKRNFVPDRDPSGDSMVGQDGRETQVTPALALSGTLMLGSLSFGAGRQRGRKTGLCPARQDTRSGDLLYRRA